MDIAIEMFVKKNSKILNILRRNDFMTINFNIEIKFVRRISRFAKEYQFSLTTIERNFVGKKPLI